MGVIRQSRSFLVDLVHNETLTFQLAPGKLQDSMSTGLKVVGVPGVDMPRVLPYLRQGRELSFQIVFVADDDARDERYVIEKTSFLQSLTYMAPISTSKRKLRLPVCMLILGEFMELPVYVKSSKTEWGPFTDERMLPLMARTSLSLVEAPGPDFVSVLAARRGKTVRRGFEFRVGGGGGGGGGG